jgi:hypothetical protein
VCVEGGGYSWWGGGGEWVANARGEGDCKRGNRGCNRPKESLQDGKEDFAEWKGGLCKRGRRGLQEVEG